ncbi:hypothetical protein TNCV_2237081 [Trichonephila clavipes]|nr:hypothetical protein TNCV_2237081 [Trichonephila clavipes]
MVWADIMMDGHNLRMFDRGTLTGQEDRNEILAQMTDFISEKMDQISSQWTIMHANTEFIGWTNTSNWKIFNDWSGLRYPLT